MYQLTQFFLVNLNNREKLKYSHLNPTKVSRERPDPYLREPLKFTVIKKDFFAEVKIQNLTQQVPKKWSKVMIGSKDGYSLANEE